MIDATHFCKRCKGNQAYMSINDRRGIVVCVECDHEWIPDGFCLHCSGALQAIGFARRNGAPHLDWSSRKYHKKCWKELNL